MKRAILGLAISGMVLGIFAQTPTPPVAVPRQAQEAQPVRPPGETLTEEQRQKVRQAAEKLRQEQTAHYEKLRNTRNELDALTRAENYDESAIRAKAQELGKTEGELAVLRAKHYKELRGVLPKEQFERMANPSSGIERRLNTIVTRTNATPPGARPQPPQPPPLGSRPKN